MLQLLQGDRLIGEDLVQDGSQGWEVVAGEIAQAELGRRLWCFHFLSHSVSEFSVDRSDLFRRVSASPADSSGFLTQKHDQIQIARRVAVAGEQHGRVCFEMPALIQQLG